MKEQVTIVVKIQLRLQTGIEGEILNDTMESYMSACNFVSDWIFTNKNLKQSEINKNLYYVVRDMFGLKSQMTQSVFRTVISRYKTIKTNTKEWIKPIFTIPQYDLLWNKDYSLKKDGIFSILTLEGRKKISFYTKGTEKYFDKSTYTFGTAKIIKKKDRFYLYVPVSFYIEKSELNNVCNVVGVDRGINFVMTTYDSKGKTKFYSGKEIKSRRLKYKKLRSELQKKHTQSAKRRLKKIGNRENRWMNDVNHCISKALVSNNHKNTLFVLENLKGIRKVTENVHKDSRYVQVSWSFYDLEQKLKYKAKIKGQNVINVSPKYTSQCCPKCGHTEPSNRNKKLHLFCCKTCGYKSNDDRIGAMNLYRKGIEYLEYHTGGKEYGSFPEGVVNHPDDVCLNNPVNIRSQTNSCL